MNVKTYVTKILLTIDEFIDAYDGAIGYVYPWNGESYYIDSNCGCLYEIDLKDGFLYCSNTMEELASAGYPNVAKQYNHDAYTKAVEVFNNSVGRDGRPPIPSKDAYTVGFIEEDFDTALSIRVQE